MITRRDLVAFVSRVIAPLERAIAMTVTRGVVKLVDDARKLQNVQVGGVSDEVQADVEHFQEYGFTSRAKPGAEALLVTVGRNRGHTIAACVTDRTVRPKGLAEGDVCLFTASGERVYLDATGDVVNLGAKSAEAFVARADATESRIAKIESYLASVAAPPGTAGGPLVPAFVKDTSVIAATKVKAT